MVSSFSSPFLGILSWFLSSLLTLSLAMEAAEVADASQVGADVSEGGPDEESVSSHAGSEDEVSLSEEK